MLKHSLEQKLLQKLSPQQIQLIKLLEVPTVQFEQRIKKELEENPALDDGKESEVEEFDNNETEEQTQDDEFSLEDYMDEDDIPSYKTSVNNYSKDNDRKEIPHRSTSSLHEDLIRQAGLANLDDNEFQIAKYIIGNIDDSGYLRRDVDSIVDDIAFTQNIETKEENLIDILKLIQKFDPAGVGARDLRECLLIQLKRKKKDNKEIKLAYKILDKAYNAFVKKHYKKIMEQFEIEEDELKKAIEIIIKLNPKPGGSSGDSTNKLIHQITPDYTLENNNEELQFSLNSKNAPELRISNSYMEMLNGYAKSKSKLTKNQKQTVKFVKQKLDSAKWFIDAIKQRQNTLILTMNAILQYQKDFFIEGDESKLKPMILKDIADKTGLDISTISRVANNKYIQTPFGIFPLKHFFSESMQKSTGESVSTKEIKMILKDCIEKEDKRNPYTDEKLAEVLKEKGYKIARRTVAKYREQLNIPVGRMRKEI